MKKFLAVILSLLMITAISGCTKSGGTPSKPDNPDDPINPIDPEKPDTETPFTVSLICEDEPFVPTNGMTAVWTATDGSGMSAPAEFDEKGIATAQSGLDGDYSVTLASLPDGYSYNPNIYTVNNERRHATIELYKILPTKGDGTDLYTHVMRFGQLGAYRITIEEQGQVIFCQYEPRGAGVFAIETIVDAAANDINPRMDIYIGTTQFKPSKPNYSLNDGGVSSVYTKNVKYEVGLSDDMHNNVYAFGLKCDSNIGYPVDIDILVTKNGEFESGPQEKFELVEPDESFYDKDGNPKTAPEGKGTFKYAYTLVGGRKILDGTKVTRGDDGFYYYTKDNGITVPLYAKIKSGNELVDFQTELVNLAFGGKNYIYIIRGYDALEKSLKGDLAENQALLERLKGSKTYYDCCNKDGAYPVNDQLKDFLKAYSVNGRFFFDGWGWAENMGYDSNDDDQWLYGCGYYD